MSSHSGRSASSTRMLTTRSGDYDSSYTHDVRNFLGTYGLVPPAVESHQTQITRDLANLRGKSTPLEKFIFLSQLRASNVHQFYRLLLQNLQELTPFIYTPTVGEACQKWSEIYSHPEGMYLSYSDRGNLLPILKNWPHNVEITVVTDGSRILGLGDLGINGMGIPIGKLALYTACAGIKPDATLPLTIDLGTGNQELIKHPLYMGSRTPKVSEKEETEFLDELMTALTQRWPGIVIQFEDWKYPFRSLERYKKTYSMFNDDIQGTGAVILGGFINALKTSSIPTNEHRAVFFGSGSAGVGVAQQIVEFFVKNGIPELEARRKFWFMDSQGLVTNDRGDKLAEHKIYFSRDDNNGKQYKTLEEVIDLVKPTILMGLSTTGGAFTPAILKKMADLNKRPIIFPLSNPSSKSECSFEDAIKYTDGRCIFASGSPFPPVKDAQGHEHFAGQGNNMYVFPGIGLATILCKAVNVTDAMIYASAYSLSTSMTPHERERGLLYPEIARIREVSVTVAVGVIRAAQADGVDRETSLRNMNDDQVAEFVKSHMYDPFLDTAHRSKEVCQATKRCYY